MSLTTTTLSIGTLLVIVAFLHGQRKKHRHALPLPPGPPGLPLVGNTFEKLTSTPWKVHHAWAKEYNSDIIHLNMAGNSLVVLDSYEACVELLDRRSGLYSSRPRFGMLKLMGWLDWNFGLMRYGEAWRVHRRIFHQVLHEQAIKSFRPYKMQMVHRMLKNILDEPHHFEEHMHLMASQLILSSIYGLDAKTNDHPYVKLAEGVVESFETTAIPGKYLVEVFPILERVPAWAPGAAFQRVAQNGLTIAKHYVDYMMEQTEEQIDAGTARYSFVSDRLGQIESEKGTEEYIRQRKIVRNVAGNMYIAAAETSVGTLLTFVHMMMLHPEVQRKAQAELDRVLPTGDLPAFDQLDTSALPYLSAVLKEVLRWNAIAPLGTPHMIETDDEYKGYRIPANTTVLANCWAMLHDPVVYPEPEKFIPERFLNDDGTPNLTVRDPSLTAFGFGRRICPGLHFAKALVWLSMASLLKVFDISPEVDASGKPLEPAVNYREGPVWYPEPFKARFRPRSTEQAKLVSNLDPDDMQG